MREIETLLRELKRYGNAGRDCALAAEDALAIAAALEVALEDAERYRWLRERWGRIEETYDDDRLVFIGDGDAGEGWDTAPDSIDAAIDAAIAKATVAAP